MVALLRQFLASLLVLLLGANTGPGDAEALVVNLGNRSLVPLLLERLNEPVVLPKGDNRNVFFDVPAKYLDSRIRGLTLLRPPYGMLGSASFVGPTQLDNATVEVPDVAVPELGPALELSREEDFSLFFPRHRVMARHLVDILISLPTYEKFLCVSAVIRDKVNPYLYAYAMSVAILNRNDTIKTLPNSASLFPQLYFQGSILARGRTEAQLFAPEDREPIEIPRNWTATDLEPEHRVAYFREDIGINLAHWQWHVHNPHSGSPSAVNKDRRGELFYYFHQQIIARYNFERLSTQLSRVNRLLNWREPIPEAYFPKLNNALASRVWPPRQADARLQASSDVRRSDAVIDILDLERWRDRIMEAIHTGRAYTSTRETVLLDNDQGIDILGNILESSDLSINSHLYGDLHNSGHVVIAYAHDPDFRHLLVVAGALQLSFSGVHVRRVEVQSVGQEPNELHTFWQKSDYNIERGLDFSSGPVLVRVTHLQHVPFFYRIQVDQKVEPDACWKGYSYCGLLGHRYPDKRPLGFPLDRLPRDEVSGINDNIETFLTPNMKIADVVLRHNDRTAPPEPIPVR
ncbi:Sex-specific storage-protein 2 [Gryllus bimaculatus]|nr:Sex-specific storage-protein 2 [Gryllus bimaculatus]